MNEPEELISFDRQDGKGGSSATATWNAERAQITFSGAWCRVPPLATPYGRPSSRTIYVWIRHKGGYVDDITAATYGLRETYG